VSSLEVKPLALRSLRKQLGWTQERMGALLCTTRTTYVHTEKGLSKSFAWGTPTSMFRIALLDAIKDILEAGRGDEIPIPRRDDVEVLEHCWLTILSIAQEVRRERD